MSWDAVTVRLKMSNSHSGTPNVFVDVYCYTEGGYPIPEEGDADGFAGGYQPNGMKGVAQRRQYDLVVQTFTVGASSYSQADYELLAKYLRAKYLWIESVTYNGGEHPRRYIGNVPFWGVSGPNVLPHEVNSSFSTEDARSKFRLTLTLRDARPTVGVTIT